jgi:hypothetical protein
MNKPRPVPSKDFEANFVNSLGNISGAIPVPVSLILITASPLLSIFSIITEIIPPVSLVNLRALLKRLSRRAIAQS